MGSMKRKFEELLTVNQLVLPRLKLWGRPSFAFCNHELPGGSPNSAIHLLAKAYMVNFDVSRVLIDTGVSCDTMNTDLFQTL